MSTTQPDPNDLSDRLPFFVYGTLRTDQPNYLWALAGMTVSETAATVTGATMFDGPGFPFVTLTAGSETVVGDLMVVADEFYDDVSANLDYLEGFTPGGSDNLYDRVIVTVTLVDNTVALAWTYVVAADLLIQVQNNTQIVGGDWVAFDTNRPRPPRPVTYRPSYV